jgi:hypothetical protein
MTILKILHLADGADIEDITRHSLYGLPVHFKDIFIINVRLLPHIRALVK